MSQRVTGPILLEEWFPNVSRVDDNTRIPFPPFP
jgi:hypothetical protein